MNTQITELLALSLDDIRRPGGIGLVVAEDLTTAQAKLAVQVERELELEDVVASSAETLGSQTPPLARLRDTHHNIARLLAQGLKAVEVAAITGFSQSRISLLRKDPAFKELLAFYRDSAATEFADAQKRLAMLAMDATAELHERLLENPADLRTTELMEIAKMAHDRSGNGPTSNVNNKTLTVTMSNDEVRALRQELERNSRGTVKNIATVRAQIAQSDGVEIRLLDGVPTVENDSSVAE